MVSGQSYRRVPCVARGYSPGAFDSDAGAVFAFDVRNLASSDAAIVHEVMVEVVDYLEPPEDYPVHWAESGTDRARAFYIEIDAPGKVSPTLFRKSSLVDSATSFLVIEPDKPERIFVMIGAPTPGLYSLRIGLTAGVKGMESTFWLAETTVFWEVPPPEVDEDDSARLVEMLKSPHRNVREVALEMLIRRPSPDAAAALPPLVHILECCPSQRQRAAAALGSLGAAAFETLPALEAVLDDPDRLTRVTAMGAIGLVDPGAKKNLPILLRGLDAEDPSVRQAAIGALAGLRGRAARAVPKLLELLAGGEAAAAAGLKAIGDASAETLETLGRGARSLDDRLRSACLDVLRSLGAPAVPQLIGAFEADDPTIVLDAADALLEIGPDAVLAADALRGLLDSSNWEMRKAAVEALGSIGPGARAAVADVARLLQDDDVEVRLSALLALPKLGEAAAGALPQLVDALEHEDWNTRCHAALALGALGESAQSAVPALQRCLEDEDSDVQEAARHAITSIEGREP